MSKKISFVWTSKYATILDKLENVSSPSITQRAAIAILKITSKGITPSADDVITFIFDEEMPSKNEMPKWRGAVGRAALKLSDPAQSLGL